MNHTAACRDQFSAATIKAPIQWETGPFEL